MAFESYPEIFERRGDSYDRAMRLYPAARAQEFQMVLELARLSPGQLVVDAPAGGGYLPKHSPTPVHWLPVETTSVFGGACTHSGVQVLRTASLTRLPIADGAVDCVISLAGVHHMSEEDKAGFYGEVHRILRPGGRFALADVHRDSPVAGFLNGFVHEHNPMGHEGLFLGEHTAGMLAKAGFHVETAQRRHYAWVFPSLQAMGHFCRLLFGIEAEDRMVVEAIGELLGFECRGHSVRMHWDLLGLAAVRQ